MYFVDRNKVEDRLTYLEVRLSLLETQTDWKTGIEKAALERVAHSIIEAVIDTGNDIIDGFIMRDPGSYDDIVDILLDEKVITEELAASLKEIISLRKMLVQEYTTIDHQKVDQVFKKNLELLKQFPIKVRSYLNNELGPVSAFKNQ
ncbi:DUF86 domain-containing protein [Bacillus sp. FSL W8-0102]|uniref:type VII toxin-antitoxin system HepT family RNase toxin n=1 Tax=Bacillus sp. FSL W8-0102 TaxID=2978205 RepID=UPI0030F7A8A8